jgi:hypothetical protein
MTYGSILLDPLTGKPLTIDHRRTHPQDCGRLEQLNGPMAHGEKQLAQSARGTSADMG